MKSLTLTIFAILATFVLMTQATVEGLDEDPDFIERVMSNLKDMAQKRARACYDNFLDPIGLYCNYKRGLPRNRRSLTRIDLE